MAGWRIWGLMHLHAAIGECALERRAALGRCIRYDALQAALCQPWTPVDWEGRLILIGWNT